MAQQRTNYSENTEFRVPKMYPKLLFIYFMYIGWIHLAVIWNNVLEPPIETQTLYSPSEQIINLDLRACSLYRRKYFQMQLTWLFMISTISRDIQKYDCMKSDIRPVNFLTLPYLVCDIIIPVKFSELTCGRFGISIVLPLFTIQ